MSFWSMPAHRTSMRRLRPTVHPRSSSRCRNAANRVSASGSFSPKGISIPMRRTRRPNLSAAAMGRMNGVPARAKMISRRFIRLPRRQGALRDPHVPEDRRSKLEDIPDVLSEGRRLDPFSPRHVRHFAESYLLDLVGELLAFRFIGRAHPVGDELLERRDVRPAEPGA